MDKREEIYTAIKHSYESAGYGYVLNETKLVNQILALDTEPPLLRQDPKIGIGQEANMNDDLFEQLKQVAAIAEKKAAEFHDILNIYMEWFKEAHKNANK